MVLGKSSIGKFKSASVPSENKVEVKLDGGDDIPGRGARTATWTIECDKSVSDITLQSVNYAGTNYQGASKSSFACPAGGGLVLILD